MSLELPWSCRPPDRPLQPSTQEETSKHKSSRQNTMAPAPTLYTWPNRSWSLTLKEASCHVVSYPVEKPMWQGSDVSSQESARTRGLPTDIRSMVYSVFFANITIQRSQFVFGLPYSLSSFHIHMRRLKIHGLGQEHLSLQDSTPFGSIESSGKRPFQVEKDDFETQHLLFQTAWVYYTSVECQILHVIRRRYRNEQKTFLQ
ncbi:uncharacterized protein LOC135228674 [Loxodonta africana]|uniref:uncharacterized protein LOC135228674 n=1 Tax=Loxodonta africana TaxID=9785 RepID=UPI0030CA7C8F